MRNDDLTEIPGVGVQTEKRLKDAGFNSMDDIAKASFEQIGRALEMNSTEIVCFLVGYARGYTGAKRKKASLSSRVRFEVLKRDAFRCQYCGKQAGAGAELEIDHIIPRAKGGTDDKENLITACKECNNGKSSKELFTEPGGAEHH